VKNANDTTARTIQPVMVTVDRSPGENYLEATLDRLKASVGDSAASDLILCDSGIGDFIHELSKQDGYGFYVHGETPVCANLNVADALEYATSLDARDMIEPGATTGADFVLFMEDDIAFIGDFFGSVARWLDDHIASRQIIYPLGANFDDVVEITRTGGTWWNYPTSQFYGTQAFLIRSRDVKGCVEYIREHCYDLHSEGTGYDHLIRDWLLSQDMMYLTTPCPSFVQHVGTQSVIKRRDVIHTFPSWPSEKWVYKGINAIDDRPVVCVLTPARNARKHLEKYFQQLAELEKALPDYRLRLVAAEGDSVDGTREALAEYATRYGIDYTHIDTTHEGKYYRSVEDPRRLEMMSKVMNQALESVRDSDEVVVWLMVDVDYNVIDIVSMIGQCEIHNHKYSIATAAIGQPGHDGSSSIIVPLVMSGESSTFYDIWAFRQNGRRFNRSEPYCEFAESGLTEIDSAGTCLVVPGSLARKYRATTTEAVSFCEAVRADGHKVYTSPQWVVKHRDGGSRLLIVGDFGTLSGYSRAMQQVLPELSAAGFDIDVIAVDWKGGPHKFPYDVWPAVTKDGDDGLGCQQLCRQLIGESYDVVITLGDVGNQQQYAHVFDSAFKKSSDIPVPICIAWCDVAAENQLAAPVLKAFDHVIVWTEWAKRELRTRAPDTVPAVSVVSLGVDTRVFTPGNNNDRLNARQSMLIDKSGGVLDDKFHDAFVVGMVGRNQERKQLGLAIASFAKFAKDNTYLLMHCPGVASSSGVDIAAVAHYYDVGDRVIQFHDRLIDVDMRRLYHMMDVLLVTSSGEGFGLPVLEAMACGVPVIVPDFGPLAEWSSGAAYSVKTAADCIVQSYTIGRRVDVNYCASEISRVYSNDDKLIRLAEGLELRSKPELGRKLAESLDVKITARKFATVVRKVVDGTIDVIPEVELVVKDDLTPVLREAEKKFDKFWPVLTDKQTELMHSKHTTDVLV